MNAPRRIQLSRVAGWCLADQSTNYVIVDRRGPWGNPWTVHPSGKQWTVRLNGGVRVLGTFDTKHEAQGFAVGMFWRWLTDDAFAQTLPDMGRGWILDSLDELRGKDLCCWCAAGSPCHAEVYIEILAARDVVPS